MPPRRAWLLNLDADEELARPAGYTPNRAVLTRSRALAAQVGPLLGPDDVLIWPDEPPPAALPDGSPTSLPLPPLPGHAWCPTPRALRALRDAGTVPAPAPPLEVIRCVNHRRFCAALGQPLPGACFADTVEEITRTVASPSPTGLWLLKRPFGFAGRGRLRIPAGPLDASALSWISASLAPDGRHGGGLQVEPWMVRCGDFSQHGHLTPAGALVLGAPCVQRCDERGTWLATARAAPADLAPDEARALHEAATTTGEALAAAGYFGPFGIDAFRFRDAAGEVRWNPRCEINARYTMGWATGMGAVRPDLA
ncbi:hypothetical protein [Chondromyces apiculatus]|uniref:ATP-grasp domain-containing protein n=1 Tax=Chondromyces apiculatus DSM 436 TaxID=1192034 RepID=A0A017T8G7_9BACT|nr:hypothetical protein [Chondromyces apiculatus]EYF04906.1 Hypothetical protein CAP_3717 [Chondromyces apiculatus DSM 436]